MEEKDVILAVDFNCSQCQKSRKKAGEIPVSRVIDKLDQCFETNDLDAAASHLEYWQREAEALFDRRGELSVVNEMLGLYRKCQEREKKVFLPWTVRWHF